MKKQIDIYIPKVVYKPYKVFFWSQKDIKFSSTTLPDKEIKPEPRVLDLSSIRRAETETRNQI
jgi:hypothetical protein